MATTVTMPMAVSPKMTDSYMPYAEFCPRCQTNITTRMDVYRGTCWWIICCIGFFCFFPLCYWLCCQSSKDAKHYCPTCGTLLAVKKGGC